jgi:2-hydroxychromene-2-carboxylate isomerase
MTRRLECYFDYRSPFPYLALAAVDELCGRLGARARWIPIRLPELSTYRERPMGHTLAKRNAYISLDMQRWARRRGVVVKPPDVLLAAVGAQRSPVLGRDHPLDTEDLLRGAVVAGWRDVFEPYLRASFRAVWGRGEDPSDPSTLTRVLDEIGEAAGPFLAAIREAATAEALDRSTREADDRGVFGVPTFFVGDEMFWGQDRLDFVEEALAGT